MKELAKLHYFFLKIIDYKNLDAIRGLNPETFAHSSRQYSPITVNSLDASNGVEGAFPELPANRRVESIRLKKHPTISHNQLAA